MIKMTITKEMKMVVVIKKDTYLIDSCVDSPGVLEGSVQIENMYGLKKDGFNYILSTLTNGTYRLYSRKKKKLYLHGKRSALKFLPIAIGSAKTNTVH